MIRADIITEWASRQAFDAALTDTQVRQLDAYQSHLLAVNAHMNLTAITDEADIAVKHFIDSLTLLPWLDAAGPGARMLDVGAGAGFPGVPLKIARPGIHLTLLDSLRKRILFLQETMQMLALEDVTCLHARAEEFSKKPEHRAQYDIVTARAVARLPVLAGYALPFLKKGGLFLAMKGPDAAGEIAEAQAVITRGGGTLAEVRLVTIAPEIVHSIVVIEKLR